MTAHETYKRTRNSKPGTIIPFYTQDGKLELYIREEMPILDKLREDARAGREYGGTLEVTKKGRNMHVEFRHSRRDTGLCLVLRDSYKRLLDRWKEGGNIIIYLVGDRYMERVMGAPLTWI